MRCGVVMFDSANNFGTGSQGATSLDSGWASIGGELARRIQSIHDLSSDVFWLCNLSDKRYFQANLYSQPNMRSEDFLRTPLRRLCPELGIDPAHTAPDVVASTLASLVQRTMDMAGDTYHIRLNSKRRLNEDFVTALALPPSAITAELHPIFEDAARHAYATPAETSSYYNGVQTLTLQRNRLIHARELMSMKVPVDSQWTHIPKRKLDGIERVLESAETPFMVNCSCSNVNPMASGVFTVGGGSKVMRNWLTDIEWNIARVYSDIEYHAVLKCEAPFVEIPQASLLPSGNYAPLSITNGLIAEQIWTSLTIPRGNNRAKTQFTAAAAWLRAKDRMTMFDYALQLHGRGLSIHGYGLGMVTVKFAEGGLRNALAVSTDTGLLPPATRLMENAGNQTYAIT